MVAIGKDLFRSRAASGGDDGTKSQSTFMSGHNLSGSSLLEHSRLMFDVVWGPLLALLSMVSDTADDARVVELCVDGFKHAIHVSCLLGMATESQAFVTSLCNFTALDAPGGTAMVST